MNNEIEINEVSLSLSAFQDGFVMNPYDEIDEDFLEQINDR